MIRQLPIAYLEDYPLTVGTATREAKIGAVHLLRGEIVICFTGSV